MKTKYEETRAEGRRYLKHRYVWEQHHGPIPEGYEVHHIDHNTHNNDISNLSLMRVHEHRSLHSKQQIGRILSENTKEKIRQKHIGMRASIETRRKMSDSYGRKVPVVCIELNKRFRTMQEAAAFINVDRRGILACLKGEQLTAGGYHWRKGE